MFDKKIAIIGCGNLGASIARGLLESKKIAKENLFLTKRHLESLNDFKKEGIFTSQDNIEALKKADVIILCVQPKQLTSLLKELSPHADKTRHIFISTVTGVSLHDMKNILGNEIALFRSMPNTAVSIRESMTCISSLKNDLCEKFKPLVEGIFSSVGEVVFIEEEQMASATVLAACGIAFALRFIRATSQGGIEVGFESHLAHKIAAQTVKGAALLLQKTNHHPECEIDRVTTPQGCTIAGLNEMEHRGFSSALIKAIATSFQKISKIADSARDEKV